MRHATATVTHLADYHASDYLIDQVLLQIRLDGVQTTVHASLSIKANPKGKTGAPLHLNGDELTLVALKRDGVTLNASAYTLSDEALIIHEVPSTPFTLEIETRLDPDSNTKLMGLYLSLIHI